MKTITLIQGSPEWHAWRRTGIGSSAAPVVLGNSPYQTPLGLYRELTGEANVEETTSGQEYIFRQGHKVEKQIRQQFFELTGVRMEPLCGQHEAYPHVLASLDGFDAKLGPLEAKLVGQEVIALARKDGSIPSHHMTQIQHQLEVTGHERGQWFGHDGKQTGILIEVYRNDEAIKRLLDAEHAFWDRVQTKNPPPLSAEDYLEPEDQALLEELREAKILADNSKIQFESLRERAGKHYGHMKVAGAGIKLVLSSPEQGAVEWKNIPEVQALAPEYLDKFRRAPNKPSWSVRIDKVKK